MYMRIQFGTWIHNCEFVSNPGNSNLINALTKNGIYTIVFDTEQEAFMAYKQILTKGYYDATNNTYSNWKG